MVNSKWAVMWVLVSFYGTAIADHDVHEKARRLQKSGDIVAAETILNKARQNYPGRVIEVDLFERDGLYLYEIELVDAKGDVKTLFFDARSGEQVKGKVRHH